MEATAEKPQRPWWVLVALLIPLFAVAVNTTAINTALPAISKDLGVSSSNLQWIVNAYLLACATFVVAGGQLGDTLGRRRMFLLGIGIFGLASLVIALASSEAVVIGGRALQGLGSAFLLPGSMSIIGVSIPAAMRPRAMAIWGAALGIGIALGPLIGGALTDSLGWQWVWWMNFPMLIAAAALVIWTVPESRDTERETGLDVLGLTTLAGGILTLVFALDQGAVWGWGSARILGLFAASAVLLSAFGMLETRLRNPMVHFETFRIRAFLASNLTTFLAFFVLIAVLFLFNIYLQNFLLLDYSAIGAGAALLPLTLALFVASLSVSALFGRFGYRAGLAFAFVMLALGMFAVSLVDVDSTLLAFLPGFILLGLGLGVTMSGTSSVGVSAVPEAKAGEASGVINMARYLGGVFGVVAVTIVYSTVATGELNARIGEDRALANQGKSLDRVLSGSETEAKNLVSSLSGAERSTFDAAAREAVVDGFRDATRVTGAVALIGVVVSLLLLGPAREHERRAHERHRGLGPSAAIHTAEHVLEHMRPGTGHGTSSAADAPSAGPDP